MPSWEFRKFAEELKATPPDNPFILGYAKTRERQARQVKTERVSCPGVSQKAEVIGGIRSEWLIPEDAPADRMVLYIHGGSWALGGVRHTRHFLAPMVQRFGIRTLHFDYRLMPECPFPAGLEDCAAVYRALLQSGWHAEDIVLSGESAGANLALALLLKLKGEGEALPAASVLMSPVTFMDSMEGSHTELLGTDLILHSDSFILSRVAELYAPDMDKKNPLLSPLYGQLDGLPPMQLFVGTDELLLDDSLRFYRKSREAGNDVTLFVGDHMVHSWPTFMHRFPEAEDAVNEMAVFIREHLLPPKQSRDLMHEKRLVDAALEEIESNYVQASLAQLAQRHHQTTYGLSKLIKRYTGHTFNQLLKRKRLAVVESMLCETEMPIKSIAMEAGYENLTHFYDIFRKRYGLSPNQLREQYRMFGQTARIDNEKE